MAGDGNKGLIMSRARKEWMDGGDGYAGGVASSVVFPSFCTNSPCRGYQAIPAIARQDRLGRQLPTGGTDRNKEVDGVLGDSGRIGVEEKRW